MHGIHGIKIALHYLINPIAPTEEEKEEEEEIIIRRRRRRRRR
jgi:hypothetical protein